MPQNKLLAFSFSRHVSREERVVNTISLDSFIIKIWLSEFLCNLAQISVCSELLSVLPGFNRIL